MSFPELTPSEAHADLDRYRLIDVRQEHEYHGPLGFVARAELFPLPSLAQARLTGERPLLFICRSGMRSGKACSMLQERGIADVTNLAGGMIGWNRAGLPVTHTPPENIAALLDQIVSWVAQVGPLTKDAVREVVEKRIHPDDPTHAEIEQLIAFIGDSLQTANPPDLDLSLDAFRRALAVL